MAASAASVVDQFLEILMSVVPVDVMRVGLSKAFGGPGSKGPSEVLCRELHSKLHCS